MKTFLFKVGETVHPIEAETIQEAFKKSIELNELNIIKGRKNVVLLGDFNDYSTIDYIIS